MKNKYYARCYATINKNTNAYRECLNIAECEKFYQELGYPFYANEEIKHDTDDNGIHVYTLVVDDMKTMLDYVRVMVNNTGANLTDKTDENLIVFALSYLGANIEDAMLSGLGEDEKAQDCPVEIIKKAHDELRKNQDEDFEDNWISLSDDWDLNLFINEDGKRCGRVYPVRKGRTMVNYKSFRID